jgi:uncharacterized RDD family membrane protein YckC
MLPAHDPANHHPDPARPRREAWAYRLTFAFVFLMVLLLLLDLPRILEIFGWALTFLGAVGVLLLLVPWGAFGQPDDDEPDPPTEVYPQ